MNTDNFIVFLIGVYRRSSAAVFLHGLSGTNLLRSVTHPMGRRSPVWPLVTLKILMAVSKELLEILVCPICKATVELKSDGSGLKCVECRRVYPIRDDIPVMLVDEARIED